MHALITGKAWSHEEGDAMMIVGLCFGLSGGLLLGLAFMMWDRKHIADDLRELQEYRREVMR